jgi:hypothetical protein
MKKFIALCGVSATLAWAGIAAADTPQGKLTGSANLGGIGLLTITTTITDGGTSFVGAGNDKSGNCNGDSGAVSFPAFPASIICAHYVASSLDGSGPKMRFAYPNPLIAGCFDVWRISDGGAGGTDKVGGASACAAPSIIQTWVNQGLFGTGLAASLNPWFFPTVTGDLIITP